MAAVNQAIGAAKQRAQEEMSKFTGGIDAENSGALSEEGC
jgi:DNA-binding protein YbaB